MSNLVYILTVVVESLLVFRAVFKLFGASLTTSIVQLLYQVTDPLVRPFLAIFHVAHAGSYLIDWPTIVALFAYGVLGFILTELVHTLTVRTRG